MKRFALLGSLAAIVACVVAAAASSEPPLWAAAPLGLVQPHGKAGRGGGGPGQNLAYHGGQIMNDAKVTAIYWGTKWGTSFVGDKRTGLATFYGGIGGSSYIGTNTEYGGSNGQVGTGVSFDGDKLDTSSSLSRAPSTSDVLAEVSRQISNPVADGYYPVYTDLPRGNAGYCAWHSWGYVGSTLVQFAFFFNLDGDAGCDPQDSSNTHSQGLEALANVSGHELSEALTDPHGDAWYDRRGAENADKCAWTFSGSENLGGTSWKIQGNWSNAAANTHSGYDGAGCINGN